MFKKKIKCPSCGEKIEKNFDFCPFCGFSLTERKKRKQEFNNFEKEFEKALKMPFFVKFPFRQLVKQMEKQIDGQLRNYDRALEKRKMEKIKQKNGLPLVSGISISISGQGDRQPIIKVRQLGGKPMPMPGLRMGTPEKFTKNKEKLELMSKAKAKKFAKLPKAEPETKVRRLTDSVVYEIALPGVKNIKEIIINKLQNSIEIKAFAKDKAYFKLLPVALPIKKYKLEKETLILELVP